MHNFSIWAQHNFKEEDTHLAIHRTWTQIVLDIACSVNTTTVPYSKPNSYFKILFQKAKVLLKNSRISLKIVRIKSIDRWEFAKKLYI